MASAENERFIEIAYSKAAKRVIMRVTGEDVILIDISMDFDISWEG